MSKLAVIALGGNALLRGNQEGTIQQQEQNTYETLKNILFLIKQGYNIVLGHGNGPQVGNILMRNDAGEEIYKIPQMPLDICVADSQGGIGYMIEKMLRKVLKEEGIEKNIITIVTQVVVDKNDNAFNNPTKRVGRLYLKKQADELAQKKGWIFKESPKMDDAWRRVVPSPKPIEIINENIIKDLANAGNIVIAAGGGGIPVYYDKNGFINSLEAVIDKDAASSLLATRINADEFYILTDVPYVYVNFNKPNQKALEFIDKNDTLKYIEQKAFGEGNMLPKMRSALRFVENGGEKSIITEATKLADKKYGTKITLNY